MKKIILALLLLCGFCNFLSAQYNRPESQVWTMGNRCGLNFSSGSPVPIASSITGLEACASISNNAGQLLFYTNGSTAWTSAGVVMPHGSNITGAGPATTLSSSQGALIVPDPLNCDVYYIFSLSIVFNTTTLYCSKINMSFNNGNGDIDTTFTLRHLPLKTGLSEKMIAIKKEENEGVWVVVHDAATPTFHAYSVTGAGVDTVPVTSLAGSGYYFTVGVMKYNATRQIIALSNVGGNSGLGLYHFNAITGSVTLSQVLDQTYAGYGCAFSPDGNKLYALASTNLYQYDLNAANPALTKVVVGQTRTTDLKLAIDNKIYFMAAVGMEDDKFYLGRIEQPNLQGAACNFRDTVPGLFFPITTPGEWRLGWGLPNEVIAGDWATGVMNRVVYNQKFCSFPASGIALQAESGHAGYAWDNGSVATSRQINQAGTYWVRYNTSCGQQTDTYKVAAMGTSPLTINYNNGVLSIPGTYSGYQWYKTGVVLLGATQQSLTITTTGWYSVLAQNGSDCVDSAAYLVNSMTGIETAEGNRPMEIYPNPAREKIYIQTANPLNYTLFGADGKLIRQGYGREIDIRTIAGGLYFLQLKDKEGRYSTTHKVSISNHDQ